jgi:hypothetical protein
MWRIVFLKKYVFVGFSLIAQWRRAKTLKKFIIYFVLSQQAILRFESLKTYFKRKNKSHAESSDNVIFHLSSTEISGRFFSSAKARRYSGDSKEGLNRFGSLQNLHFSNLKT